MGHGINDNNLDIKVDNSGDVQKKKASKNSMIDSNNQTVNLSYDPNKVELELVKEIADLRSKFRIKITDLMLNCEQCKKNHQEILENIFKQRNEAIKKYDLEKQFNSGKFLRTHSGPIVNEFDAKINALNNGFNFSFLCEEHLKKDLSTLQNMKIQIEELEHSIKLIS